MSSVAETFVTPEWRERLQLVLHLLNSAERIPFIRGPEGAGKTTFGHLLEAELEPGTGYAWQDVGSEIDAQIALERAGSVSPETAPEDLPGLGAGPVLFLDNADELGQEQVQGLLQLRTQGVRPVLLGKDVSEWGEIEDVIQYVDLPACSRSALAEFLDHLGYPATAGPGDDIENLMRLTGGYPGLVVRHLEREPVAAPESTVASRPDRQIKPLLWGGIGLLALVVVVAMLMAPGEVDTVDETAVAIPPTAGTLALPQKTKQSEHSLPDNESQTVESPLDYDAWTMAPIEDEEFPYQPIRFAAPSSLAQQRRVPSPKVVSPPAAPVVVASKPAAAPAKPSTGRKSVPVAKKSWLDRQQPSHYTLQVVGAGERAAVEKFVKNNNIRGEHAIFGSKLKGKPWYSLVVGSYPDRAGAIAAKDRLPKGLGTQAWPRTFASVRDQMGQGN